MQKFGFIFLFFSLFFVGGYSFISSTTDPITVERDPAAIKSTFDFSHLQGESLQEAVKKRLLTGFKINKSAEGVSIGLGHFVFIDSSGEKKLACQEFQKVLLTFEADGVSVDGDRPSMEIAGPCEFSPDMSLISPVFLPIAKILNETPGDGEFQFNDVGPIVKIRFSNLADSWPRTWILKSVQLESDKTLNTFKVSNDEVTKYVGHPMVLTW